MRRVREHVERARAHEPVAVLLDEALRVAGERRRVAGDVDDARRGRARRAASAPCRRGPARGGSTTTTSGSPARSRRSRSTWPTFPAKKAALPIEFSSAFSIAQATDSSEISIPQTVSASRASESADRADPAVEVVDRLAAGQRRPPRADELVEPLGHRACSSAGRRSGGRGSGARRAPPRSPPRPRGARSAGSSPRPGVSLTVQWIERTSGNAVSTSIRRSRSKRSRSCGDELDERLAGVAALADDEVAEVALAARLVVGLRAAPRAPSRASALRIPLPRSVVSQQRSMLEHLVPAARRGGGRAPGPSSARARTSTPSCCGSGRAPRRPTIGSSGGSAIPAMRRSESSTQACFAASWAS